MGRSLAVFLILVPALVILWGLPSRTADAWSWTIKPDLTPIFLGAGYGPARTSTSAA